MPNLRAEVEQALQDGKIDMLNDVLFKFIFKEEHKQLLIAFLNAMLDRPAGQEIKELHYGNTEKVPLQEDRKLTRLDLYVTTEQGTQIDIEVQIVDHRNMEQRSLYYWSQMYVEDLLQGHDYISLKPTISLNLLRYVSFPEEPVHTKFGIFSEATKQRYCRDLEIHFFQLPKFEKRPVSRLNRMERWIAYFSNALDKQELKELIMTDADLQKVSETAGLFFQNTAERRAYIDRQVAIMDYEYDKRAYIAEGRAEGITEGIAKGRAEGIAEGITKGRAEGEEQKQIEMTRKMKALGMDLATIAKISGFSIEEIQAL